MSSKKNGKESKSKSASKSESKSEEAPKLSKLEKEVKEFAPAAKVVRGNLKSAIEKVETTLESIKKAKKFTGKGERLEKMLVQMNAISKDLKEKYGEAW